MPLQLQPYGFQVGELLSKLPADTGRDGRSSWPDRCCSSRGAADAEPRATTQPLSPRDGQILRGQSSPAVKRSADCVLQEAGRTSCSCTLPVGSETCALPSSQGGGFRGPAFSIGRLLLRALLRPTAVLPFLQVRVGRSSGCAWMVSWRPWCSGLRATFRRRTQSQSCFSKSLLGPSSLDPWRRM